MKSIKPGRGPSFRGALGSIFALIIGIVWTFIAANVFAPMAIFGIFFIIIALMNVIRGFKNAFGENRESMYDIVDSHEELDPYEARFGKREENSADKKENDGGFCPYCGAKTEKDYAFCAECGKKLP